MSVIDKRPGLFSFQLALTPSAQRVTIFSMSEFKRVIVTGATGLIGRKLFAALRERRYAVVVFSRSPEQARAALPGAADYVSWTPTERGPWAEAIDGAHAVIHLAGAPISKGLVGPRWTPEYKAEIRDSRVVGTRGIVNAMAAAAQPPAVLVCASAIGYYGYSDSRPLDESAPAGSDFVARICVDWEAEAARAAQNGARVVLVRTGVVLDPEQGALAQLLLPFRMFSGGPVLPGSQYYSWIHPDDEIGILMLALEDGRLSGPVNATAPEPQTNRDFSATLGKVVGTPSWLPVPETALRVALGEMADLVVKGQRVLPKRALELGYRFRYPRLEDALRQLLKA